MPRRRNTPIDEIFAPGIPEREGPIPEELERKPFETWPLNGLLCSVCQRPQRTTPSGAACGHPDGHGGADGIEPPKKKLVNEAAFGTSFFYGGPDSVESVKPVKLGNARPLYTIEPTDPIWKLGDDDDTKIVQNVRGGIVRLRPPMGVDDATIEGLVMLLEGMGAARVFTLPRPKSTVLPEAVHVPEQRAKVFGARAAVESLVKESNSEDREALEAFTQKVMAEAGL
jgi:hypothetical protein